jgi:hypothetical protein
METLSVRIKGAFNMKFNAFSGGVKKVFKTEWQIGHCLTQFLNLL